MNLKDLQTLLETFVAYESISYDPSLVDRITLKLIQELDATNKADVTNQLMHSLFKSYKTIRYPKSNIFEKLTEVMIHKVQAGNCDE
jgi:hypothetical protein